MLNGRVDDLQNGHLSGWAFNSDDPDEHLLIRINYKTQVVASTVANILRPDLAEAGIGKGDHAFRVPMPPNYTSTQGLTVLAQSQRHGDVTLAIASNDERHLETLFQQFGAQYEQSLILLKAEIDALKARPQGASTEQVASLPEEFEERLRRLENRVESSEVFFVRIDGMMRQLIEEKKKRRKRFLGLF